MTEQLAELFTMLILLALALFLVCIDQMTIGEFMICIFISCLIDRVIEVRDKLEKKHE